MASNSFTRHGLAPVLVVAFAVLPLPALRAKEKTPPAPQVLDVGRYHVTWVPAHNWETTVKRESDYVVFHFTDKPSMTAAATIGLFRAVVPAAVRSGDRAQIAAAFGSADVLGAQKALFGGNAGLVPQSKRPAAVNGGEVFSYVEPSDVGDRRSSTRFARAWVFFPQNYAATGVLYLAVGREDFGELAIRPDELEKADEIIAGIREP